MCEELVVLSNNLINQQIVYCLVFVLARAELYGDTYVFFFLHHALVYTQSAEAIKTVLITGDQENFHKTPEIVVRFLYGER